uniref:Uncharacterized protein n=1 Tax=Paramormyrops kingsleyae TaxID=1676925 RepID=A0A3B3RX73_9TELE
LQKTSMGVYISNREEEVTRTSTDIGILVERIIVLEDIGSLARVCALMLGVICVERHFNILCILCLRHYFKFIQKVLLQLGGDKFSPEVLGLKNKIMGLYFLIVYSNPSEIIR